MLIQLELDREVARKTGEVLREIRRRGFSLADPEEPDFDPEPNRLPSQSIDWDEIDDRSVSLFPCRRESAQRRMLGV